MLARALFARRRRYATRSRRLYAKNGKKYDDLFKLVSDKMVCILEFTSCLNDEKAATIRTLGLGTETGYMCTGIL